MASSNILKALGWIPALATGAKSFRDNPVIGSPTLNRWGLHVARVRTAHAVARYRQSRMTHFMPADERARYQRDGYVTIDGFLSPSDLEQIRAELPALGGQARAMHQGDTITQRLLLTREATTDTPQLNALTHNPALLERLMYAEAKAHLPLLYLQHIRHGALADAGLTDPQKTLHADTFHPTMKAWLYLQDVGEEIGPLSYVPRSNRLTEGRLAFEYDRSLVARNQPDRYSEKGSFRVRDGDLARYGFADPVKLTVKAGTLVIANTFGFHGRSPAAPGMSRMEIFAYGRTSPFVPWASSPSPALLRLEHSVFTAYWNDRGRKAEAKGRRATWHPIATDDMIA